MADVSVRPARADDAARVAQVQLDTWRQAYSWLPEPPVTVDEVADAWRAAVTAPPSERHRVLVALDGDEVVGFASTEPGEDGSAEMTTLLVEPRWGRRGHGSRLLAAAVDHWRQDAVPTAYCWVWVRDQATSGLLVAAGWEPDGAGRGLDVGGRVEHQRRLHVAP